MAIGRNSIWSEIKRKKNMKSWKDNKVYSLLVADTESTYSVNTVENGMSTLYETACLCVFFGMLVAERDNNRNGGDKTYKQGEKSLVSEERYRRITHMCTHTLLSILC